MINAFIALFNSITAIFTLTSEVIQEGGEQAKGTIVETLKTTHNLAKASSSFAEELEKQSTRACADMFTDVFTDGTST